MANSYSAPNFNVDTTTTLSALETAVGHVSTVEDLIYVYNGAILMIDKAYAGLKIILGQTSAGAAGGGNRYGLLVINAGITMTWDGNATNTNSGIGSSPTSADASSKGCSLVSLGTSVSPVVMTNSVGALNTANRWTISMTYGIVNFPWVNAYYQYLNLFTTLAVNSSNTNATSQEINNCTTSPCGATANLATTVNQAVNIPINIKQCLFDGTGVSSSTAILVPGGTGSALAAGGSINVDGSRIICTSNRTFIPTYLYSGAAQTVYANEKLSLVDIRPTQVIPLTLAFTNPGLGGCLRFTISNAASYVATDEIYIYNSVGDTFMGCVTIAKYNAIGYGVVSGLTDGTAYTLYAKATSDLLTFSAASANAGAATPGHLSYDFPDVANTRPPDTTDGVTGTQTALATDADYLALEAARNKFNAGSSVADLLLTKSVKLLGVDNNGTLVALVVPAAPTNLVFTNITDNSFRVSWTPGARSETYKVYVDGVLHTAGISDAYLDIGSRSPLTSYSITVLGTNVTGDGTASAAYTVMTLASDSTEDSTTLSTDGVTVATVSGSPKIVGSGATNKIYDVRIINKALTVNVSSYYWKDVLENEGKVVIPR